MSKKASAERVAETARMFAAAILQAPTTDEDTKVASIAWKMAKAIENKIARELAKGDSALDEDSDEKDDKKEEKVEKKKKKDDDEEDEKPKKNDKKKNEDEDEEDDEDDD